MEELNTLGYDWECGHEELMIEVDSYAYGENLYIELNHMEEGQVESFATLTVNLPYSPFEPGLPVNQAYIEPFAEKSKLEFIKKHKLGKILSDKGFSGMQVYSLVAFDLKRLAEFDPKGVKNYCKFRGITEEEIEKTSLQKSNKKTKQKPEKNKRKGR